MVAGEPSAPPRPARKTVGLGGLVGLLGLLALLLLGGRSVHAGPPSSPELAETSVDLDLRSIDSDRLRLAWRPASVIWPLAPLGAEHYDAGFTPRLEQRAAMLRGDQVAPSVRGVVEIDRERAVGVWIAALETVRVRQLGGAVPLRFVRGVDGHAALIDPGRPVTPGPGGERRWELHQPPGEGGLWSIEADEPTQVLIERVEPRGPRYVDVEVEVEVLEWIEAQGADADLPTLLEPAGEARGQLLLHAALARELLGLPDAKLQRRAADRLADAVEAWRGLAAINTLDRDRPAVRPYYARDRKRSRPIRLADSEAVELDVDDSREYRLVHRPRRWTVERKGPGQLRIAARTWAPAGTELAAAELRVHAGGRVIARIPLSRRPAQHGDREAALPRFDALLTTAGDPVGELAERSIVLGPGRHDYELELVGGPALLAIEGARRIDSTAAGFRGWTPRRRAKLVTRALERDNSSAGASAGATAHEWLELLLAEQTHAGVNMAIDDRRFDDLAQRSPLLAAVALAIVAADPSLDRAAFSAAVARLQPLLAALDRDRTLAPAARGQVRARWIELLALHDRPELVTAVIADTGAGNDPIAELPVDALRVLAELLGPSRASTRSLALAVLELARARAPADLSLRGQYLRLWTEATSWSRRRPTPPDDDVVLRPAGEWLVQRQTLLDDPREQRGVWVRLEPGVPVQVRAELGADSPSASADRRMRLFDLHVATPPGEREPVLLRVDDRRWWSPLLTVVQRHRFAVAPGVHELELRGPPGTVAWAELPPAEPFTAAIEARSLGRRETMWPLANSRWRVPGPAVPGFVRLELRWPEDLPTRPVWIRVIEDGDEDRPRRVLFDPGAALEIDREALPINHSAWASDRHDLVLPIAAATAQIRFEVEDELPIPASLSLRRQASDELELEPESGGTASQASTHAALASLATDDREALLAELAHASRVLLAEPDDLHARARRVALLLLLGETGFARADLLRLADDPRDEAAELLAELEQRIHALIEPRELVLAEHERARRAAPALIEPAIAAVLGDDRQRAEPWLEPWALARAAELDEALATFDAELARLPRGDHQARLLGELSRAHLLATAPERAREAGRAWLTLYGRQSGSLAAVREPIAVGLAAVRPLIAHLEDPHSDARDAGLAYGLAGELEPVFGHTTIRRLAFLAALRSDWSRLDHSEDNAGFERLELPVAELRPTPEAEIREALLVAPWPATEAELLRPGRVGVLAWDARPGSMHARLWCRATRPDLGSGPVEPARARVRLFAEGRRAMILERELELHDAALERVELPIAGRGRHRLEVLLGDDPRWLCSWSNSTPAAEQVAEQAEQVIEARRRAQWWASESGRGVELTVLGPASLAIETRAVVDPRPERQPQRLLVAVERPAGADPSLDHGELVLASEAERTVITENLRSFDVTHADTHVLLLTEDGPHRIRLTSDRGRVLVRARLRRDRGDVTPPEPLATRRPTAPALDELSDELDWRSAGLVPEIIAHEPRPSTARRFGTLELRVRGGLDDIGELDDLDPRVGMMTRVGWRRELVDDLLWLMIAGETRLRDRSEAAGGGLLHLRVDIPVLGVRTGVDAQALAQPFDGDTEASVRLYGFVDRPTWVSHHLMLRPGVTAGWRWQSLDPARVDAATTELEPHPRIYQRYIHDHPIMLRPELELRAYPFQDLAVWTEAQLVTNSDIRSVDHLNFEAGFEGIVRRPRPWVPTWGASYQASPRFADANRPEFFWRHRLDARVGAAVWARDLARVAFGASHQLYWSPIAPIRNVIELWIRVDAAFGRRMRDHGPRELWFREPWAPRAWDDEDRQARSTQTPRQR